MGIKRLTTGRAIAAVAISGFVLAVGASKVGAGVPENPGVVQNGAATCYDAITDTGGDVSFTVTNPLDGGPAMNFTASIADVGSFGSAALADGASQGGGFGGLTPAVYVLNVTTTAGGAAALTFVIDPCLPPPTTSTSTTTTTTTTTTSTTTTTTTLPPTTLPATTTTDPPTAGILPATR